MTQIVTQELEQEQTQARICPVCKGIIGAPFPIGCRCQNRHPAHDLADEAIKVWPENASRFQKAADLVAAEDVEVFELTWQGGFNGDVVGRVWSQTENGRFHILRRLHLEDELAAPKDPNGERWIVRCDCYDYQHGNAPMRNGQRFCKHVAAYRMAVKLAKAAADEMGFDERNAAHQRRQDAKRLFERQQIDRANGRYRHSTQGARRYLQMAAANGVGSFAADSTASDKLWQVKAAAAQAAVDRINEELFG
ncbi:MAG: hypothetical protein H6662_15430 [Ardenticatenaceae bacterium]|nr:hypothetical protein [Anaerolineales bacterium]MCB8922978.1 hypothetical protein [Ardenticatenaceae bacterium]MCB8990289.1 hypothetical protein [Ardenticatenaceae bacterium]